jgi:hypothetical protein
VTVAQRFITEHLAEAVASRRLPGVTLWNRLEGRPRTASFERALRAEVRDALWMLTRQWQLGEFHGDDAGSPITTRVRFATTPLRGYRPGAGASEPFDDSTPLEARVEQLPVPFAAGDTEIALDLRLLMGRYWLKLVATLGVPAARAQYILAYPVAAPDPTQEADAPVCAHPEALAAASVAAGRLMDGGALYEHLTGGGGAADGIAALGGKVAQTNELGDRFVAWFQGLIYQPTQPSAWEPDRLEYRFACTTETGAELVADEYYHGHLDWYNLDARTPGHGDGTATNISALPTSVTFNGMPNTRWWSFEDGRTNFGDVKPDTTDLAKLLLIEFGLVYANDWFQMPISVQAGSLVTVQGVAVTNVFGERTWVEPAGAGSDEWRLFALGHDLGLAILPVAQKVLDGRPQDEVMLVRDEMANMVWAVERAITLPSGDPKFGAEAGRELLAFLTADFERRHGHLPEPPAFAEGAKVRYRVMTSVPEQWIAMIPVHVTGDNRQIQLQRAAMLRIFDGDDVDPLPVRPRTWLMRQGLDDGDPYFLHEEEVPRAGVVVTRGYARTRWRDGRVWVWLGARKRTGRGEASSGLAFDQLADLQRP